MPPIPGTESSGVYLWHFARVKWIVCVGLSGFSIASLAAGCVSPPTNTATSRAFAPIGVWYSVATASSVATAGLGRQLERDFASIKQMKMNAVFVRHYFPADLAAVLEAANKHELKVIVSDPAAIRYLRAGAGGSPQFSTAAVFSEDPSITARYIGHVVDTDTHRRARRLAGVAREVLPPIAVCVSADPEGQTGRDMSDFDHVIWNAPGPVTDERPWGGIQTVDCRRHRRDEEATVRQWLASYHRGLLHGQGGGIVFNAYRALPGNWTGIVEDDRPPAPERIAMLRRIIRRSDRWRDRLAGLQVKPVKGDHDAPDLETGLFSNDRLSYLMLVNTSATRFFRQSVTFPAGFDDLDVERAVAVTRAEDATVGKVFRTRRGELVIPLDLAPGEAELFELF